MRDLYDEMLDDIEEQEKKNSTQFPVEESEYEDDLIESLDDLQQYDMDEEAEDDFDIAYRTPEWAFDKNQRKADLLVGTVLPEEITITDNVDEYLMEKDEKYGDFIDKFPGPKPYNDVNKQKKYNKAVAENGGTAAVYSAGYDEVIIEDDLLKNAPIKKVVAFLSHENIHKKERDIEYRKPMPRVESEPNTKMFQQMYDNNIIQNDLTRSFKGAKIGADNPVERKQFVKNRRDMSDRFRNDYPFSEQLAYYGENNLGSAIRNPRRKTDRVLNRMWFE